jgi:hypothetical protein
MSEKTQTCDGDAFKKDMARDDAIACHNQDQSTVFTGSRASPTRC